MSNPYNKRVAKEIAALPLAEKELYDSGKLVQYDDCVHMKGHLSFCRKDHDPESCELFHFNDKRVFACSCILYKKQVCYTTWVRKEDYKTCRALCPKMAECTDIEKCKNNHISNEHDPDECGNDCEHIKCAHGNILGKCLYHVLFNLVYSGDNKKSTFVCSRGDDCPFKEEVRVILINPDGEYAGSVNYHCRFKHI